jgi:hypothetical protein
MKNKKIILIALTVFLLIVIGSATYFIITLNSRTKTQANDIESLKTTTLNNVVVKEQEASKIEQANTNSHIIPELVYDEGKYKVYAFNNSMQGLDLNSDGITDVVIKSRIIGADYYSAREVSERDVYSFYIDRAEDTPGQEYYNIITKESLGGKIGEFDRDFVMRNLGVPACNAGETLRIVINTEASTTVLAIVKMENGDSFENYANFELYKLKMSGTVSGSDYIFSYLKTVRSRYASCDLEQFADDDVVAAVKEAGF